MGTFYRSRHELIYVWKVGTAAHTNTFGLGETGRYRTNVWDYPGVNSFGANQKDLALHPTVKPVALVADAIKDVTRRGDAPALIRAITIMLEVQPAVEARTDGRRRQRDELIARFEKLGLPTEALRQRPLEDG